ncbi:hypothetical protein ABB37_01312 [Leptomonas pyrrhocoris]|uniref:Ubiquitin-like domain-containing protein n=1 Tax=Leptomonas pyrrhocoris TaxID=157538 RepID=A0A0N1J5B4_LEPPY|nr:hypothetical protein ABB37_01312 [Leptomonas pyrrhocoris]KPA84841.1 hypothetical protein ABB37_01312 [Leptomonas pyrrhocoris]|eukprot:XP_015663280.1 hypothetical protein ABB37_01312 [Leptomonas pyrrhocoris]
MSGEVNFSGSDVDSADEWANPPQRTNTAPIAAAAEQRGAAAAGTRSLGEMDAVERDLAGDAVPVVFELPNGDQYAAKFFMGQSVEHLKVLLEKEKKLPYDTTTLYLGDRMLLDPLSLSDLPFEANVENHVKVVMTA